MKKILLTLLVICFTTFGFGQSYQNAKLIELGKAYKDFMFRNEPPRGFVKELQIVVADNLKPAANFIVQTITTDIHRRRNAWLFLHVQVQTQLP